MIENRSGSDKDIKRKKNRRYLWDQRGSVLMVLIVTMIILAILTAALLPTLFTTEMEQISASGAMKAHYLAEGGGRYALSRLEEITQGTHHTFKFSDGNTFFEIEKISGTEFTSTAIVSAGTNLEARVRLTYTLSGGLFDYGIFGGDGVIVGNNATVEGDVGTNDDNLDGISGSANVTGERDWSAERDMAPEELPAGAASWTDKTSELDMSSNNRTVNLGTGEYYSAAIDISNNSTVNITGAVVIYVEGTTTASNNSTININSGASLTIYAGGSINLSNNSLAAPDQVAADFIIYGLAACQNIILSNNSTTYAAIYAPAANITVGNNGIVHGSLIGETITAGNNAEIYYDDGIQGIGADNTTVEEYFTEN